MISDYLYILYNLIRFGAFGFSALLPLLGALSTNHQLSIIQLILLLLVSLSFHSYAYMLNDIIDLPLDKTQVQRAHFPLVRGVVKPSHAFIYAMLQLPMCIILTTILSGNIYSYAFLGTSFILMSIYDILGKKISCPPITDAAQGSSWGCLLLYGATISSFHATHLTIVLVAYVIVFTLIVNGCQGGIRDLRNDIKAGVKTTAIYFGAEVNDNRLTISGGLILYTVILQILLILLSLFPVLFNWLPYTHIQYTFLFFIIIFFDMVSSLLLFIPIRFINSSKPFYMARAYIGQISVIMGMGYVITSITLLYLLFIYSKNIVLTISIPIIYLVCGVATYLAAHYEKCNRIEKAKIL
jgi:4-hydroxybenzoate polyprenyltransferase